MNTLKFKGRIVDMLIACLTITEHAIANSDLLVVSRPLWGGDFFVNHRTRINTAFTTILGADNAAHLRNATQLVESLHAEATGIIRDLKTQIREDFKKDPARRSEILKTLGYSIAGLGRVQDVLVQFLFQFQTNLTDSLRAEIQDKGVAPAVIDRILGLAEQFSQANITQEVLKGNKRELSAEAVSTLNDIYADTITIARIAYRLFKDNPAKQALFSYAGTLRRLTSTAKKDKPAAVSE